MGKVSPRSASPFIAKIRDFCIGRSCIDNNRFSANVSARTQPDPDIPGGASHKIAANYYCSRDGRHDVTPPFVLAVNTKAKQIAASGASSDSSEARPISKRLPGKVFNY